MFVETLTSCSSRVRHPLFFAIPSIHACTAMLFISSGLAEANWNVAEPMKRIGSRKMFGLYRCGGAKCHRWSHLQEWSLSILRPTRAAGWAGCFCSCFQSNRMHFWAASLGPNWHLLPACTKVRMVLQSRLGSGSNRNASYCWTTSSEFWKTFQST
jgi:hypothetical protein